MHSLEPEIQELLRNKGLSEAEGRVPLALETRRIFSLRRELRIVFSLGIAAVMTGVGLVVKENLNRIDSLSIILALIIAAGLCYLPAVRDGRAARLRRLPADGFLFLGALLVSATLGYAEHSFHLLGPNWTRHLLLLTLFHGATAYLFGSRALLSLALASFAAWFGAETTFSYFFPLSRANLEASGWRCLICAAIFVACRLLQVSRASGHRDFIGVYEHFAVHLASIGALLLMLPGYLDRPSPRVSLLLGTAVLAAVVALVGSIGWRRRQESFVLAALAYASIGAWRLEFHVLEGRIPLTAASLVTLVLAITVLWRVHARFRDTT